MTSRYCDCGAAPGRGGATERATQRKRKLIEHKLDRLRRKGWSRNRVQRRLAQVEADEDRQAKAKTEKVANDAAGVARLATSCR